MTYDGTIAWFGVKWDAPMTDEAPEEPTPVGDHCMYCSEIIAAGESGITMPYMRDAHLKPERAPAHIECFLRSIIGSVAHQQHRCSCYGGTEDDSDARSYREQAREAMAWLMEHRGQESP